MVTKNPGAKKVRAVRDNASMGRVVFLRPEVQKVSTRPWMTAFRGRPFAFLVISVLAIVSLAFTVTGTSFDYYPQTCVGSWFSPANAQGQPTLQRNIASLRDFDITNSAVFYGGTHSIICQDFTGQSIPEEMTLSSLKVTVSLAVKHPVVPVAVEPATPEEEPVTVPEEELPEGASNESEFTIVDEPVVETPPADGGEVVEPTPEEGVVEQPSDEPVVSEPAPAEESAPAEAPAADPAPASEPAPAEESAPAEAPAADPAPASEPAPSSDSSSESAPAGDSGSSESSAFLNKLIKSAQAQEISNVLAAVEYSLDGDDWRFLGNVTQKSNWKTLTFLIPVGEGGVASVADIPNLRIRFNAGFFSVDSPVEIYLDGMEVEIRTDEYTDPEVVVPGLEELGLISEAPLSAFDFDQTFSLARTVIPAEEVLPWQPYDYQIENADDSKEVSKSVAVENPKTEGILVSGACKKDYFTVLVFSDPEAYANAPRTALFNSAYPCDNGSYSYNLVPGTLRLPEGQYYLLVADQPEGGPWVPISAVMPFTIEPKL